LWPVASVLESPRMRLAVTDGEVVTAVLGVSAALAGFNLVFLGIAITAYQAFPSETARLVRGPYRRLAGISLAAFLASLLTVALGVWWLARSQPGWAYQALLVLSPVQLILVMLTGLAATLRVMRT
jgi:hypothetical protein